MAEPVAALASPLHRETKVDETDFAALLGALQETVRGRWFLDEFARRQRNADTVMVLDAVARIEARMAAQQAEPPAGAAVADLTRIIDEGRMALAQATEALTVFDSLKARLDAASAPAAGASPASTAEAPPALQPEPAATAMPAPTLDLPAASAASPEPLAAALATAAEPAAGSAMTPINAAPADTPPDAETLSLGRALLTEGVVTLPAPAAPEALAALQRMTQAERIAFFS